MVAGIYGAATVSRRIPYVQAAPAALALILLWLAQGRWLRRLCLALPQPPPQYPANDGAHQV
jgi:hypothetical protein